MSLTFAAGATVQIRKITKTTLLPAPPPKKVAGFSNLHRIGWALTAAASFVAAAAGPAEYAALAGKVFLMAGTIGGYLLGTMTPPKVQMFFHPLIVCALTANAAAAALGAVSGVSWGGVLTAFVAARFPTLFPAHLRRRCGMQRQLQLIPCAAQSN